MTWHQAFVCVRLSEFTGLGQPNHYRLVCTKYYQRLTINRRHHPAKVSTWKPMALSRRQMAKGRAFPLSIFQPDG